MADQITTITLQEIFDDAVHGELSNHSMGTELSGNRLSPQHWNKVINLTNRILKIIYTKFFIKEDQVHIDLYDHIMNYELSSAFAKTNTDPQYINNTKYISDSIVTPFTDNIVNIIAVYDELGREKFLNDSSEYWSLHTLTNTTITHPYPDKENTIAVSYQALHPKIILPNVISPNFDIPLEVPTVFHNLISLYIGSKIQVNLHKEARMAEGQFYYGKYKEELNSLINGNVSLDRQQTDTAITDDGWV